MSSPEQGSPEEGIPEQATADYGRPQAESARYLVPKQTLPTLQGKPFEGYSGDNAGFAAAPQTFQGVALPIEGSSGQSALLGKAVLFGAAGAALGSVAWGLFSLTNFMVGFVAIAVGWLVGKAMMTATGGVGGRQFQVAAVILTYFGCTLGDVLGYVFKSEGHHVMSPVVIALYMVAGPFLELSNPINGVLGLVILWVGVRAAWRLTAGSPGFGGTGVSPRVGPFGI